MVLLLTFSVITALGFAAWVFGYAIDHPEISVIGTILILGAGGLVMVEGLEIRDGEVEKVADVGGQNETHYITPTYRQVSTIQQFDVGFMTMLLGGVGTMLAFKRFEEIA